MAPPKKSQASPNPDCDSTKGKRKPVRRDPAKRKEQNRRAQEKYREKQKRRIEDLERHAEATAGERPEGTFSGPAMDASTYRDAASASMGMSSGSSTTTNLCPDPLIVPTGIDLISPIALQAATQDPVHPPLPTQDFDLETFMAPFPDHWLHTFSTEDGSYGAKIYFDCGCSTLHIPLPTSASLLLPVRPLNPYINTLRLDIWCVLAALLENCLHLGIPKSSFCSDDGVSPFYRPSAAGESARILQSMKSMTSTLKYDLRPLDNQIVKFHHPYIDVLPWKDLRENLMSVAEAEEIDEDEFLHDFFNHATCWGGVAGAKTGSPWDGRSWEASETFLVKWANVIGGDDGELTRQSRWWRHFRGEDGRVSEVS